MSARALDDAAAAALAQCIEKGGVAVFPADTVYGLACDPTSERAVARLYELKGRPEQKPAAVMFFALEPALAELREIEPRTRLALRALLPGAVTLLLENPRDRYPLACRPGTSALTPAAPLGLRVPDWPVPLLPMAKVNVPALQSSANLSGETAPRSLEGVPPSILEGADLVIDGGQLPGTPSTVIDLRRFEQHGRWSVVREGALSAATVADALAAGLSGDASTLAGH